MRNFLLAAVLCFAGSALAQTTISNGTSSGCSYYSHGPYVPVTYSCLVATSDGGSIGFSNFAVGYFAQTLPGWTTGFWRYNSFGNVIGQGAMTGTYVPPTTTTLGSLTVIFSDGAGFSGSSSEVVKLGMVCGYRGVCVARPFLVSGTTTFN